MASATTLKIERIRKGLGQAHVARVIGMPAAYLSRFEQQPTDLPARYRAALAEPGECFEGCGCKRGLK